MGRLMELATGYWASAALGAAVELDVFGALKAPATAADVAARRSSDARAMEELLDTLVALGLLSRAGDRYELHPDTASLLDPDSPACLLDALRFNLDLYPLWGRLAETVRTGKPALPPRTHLGTDPVRTRRFAMGMHSRALGLAPALLPALELAGVRRLLDVGAGPGTFSRRLAEREPGLTVLQLDLPGVLAVARELAATSPAAARLEFHDADYRADPLPAGADAILYCGALHQENPETARALFEKFFRALPPGGWVCVVDLMLRDAHEGPPFVHLFSLNMLLTSPFGRVFAASEAAALLRAAGFADLQTHPAPGIPYTVIRGRRP